ncbi:MAG: Hsp20/alpha crystallin family protein [Gammaproteobacteria bacterium]
MTRRDYDMWSEAVALIERAERLQRQFFRRGAAPASGPVWEPPVDVFETENELYILVALPGVPPEQVQVEHEHGALIISGARPLPAGMRRASIHRLEVPYGRFERRLALPLGRYQYASQELAHGCLLIGLRKLDEARHG